jgi:hypothetical protein
MEREFIEKTLSRLEPMNLTCEWPRIAILRNILWYVGLRRANWLQASLISME